MSTTTITERKLVVVSKPGTVTRVVATPQTIAAVAAARPVIQVPASGLKQPVVAQTRPVIDVTGRQGLPGPRGPRGLPGADALPPVDFDFDVASPFPLHVLGEDTLITMARLRIGTAFNGAGASLSIGIAGQPDLLLPAGYVNPAKQASYEAAPDVLLPEGTTILLFVTPGSAAVQGSGQVFINIASTED
jgi:hypothetical protein